MASLPTHSRVGTMVRHAWAAALTSMVALATLIILPSSVAAQSCPAFSLEGQFSAASVAVGEEVDLIVTLTNNSPNQLVAFTTHIGNLTPFLPPTGLEYSGIFEHFLVMDTHHPVGRIYTRNFTDPNNSEKQQIGLDWSLDNRLSLERLAPGESATARIRLKAIGEPGTLNVPLQLSNLPDTPEYCYYSTQASVEITEGSIAEPLLIQKTVMANDLFDCIRLGDEAYTLWQIRNTTNQPRVVRFRDEIPGYLYYAPYDDTFSGYLSNSEGTYPILDAAGNTSDGMVSILQSNTITLPPHSTFHVSNFFDISAFAVPSKLVSPFKVWETNSNDTSSLPPADALTTLNTAVDVCEPILTKTGTPSVCGLSGEQVIDYEVRIEQVILGSAFARSILEDMHANGTSFIPNADPGKSGDITEYTESSRTFWTYFGLGVGSGIDTGDDEETVTYRDRLRLRYRTSVDNVNVPNYVNRFNLYNTHTKAYSDDYSEKLAVTADMQFGNRKPGDAFRGPEADAMKQASVAGLHQDSQPLLFQALDTAELVATASHTTLNDCPSISGYKFNDLNGNGRRDSGEPGVESWMIIAQSSEGTHTAVTDENGYYRMTVPYAVWQVREVYQLGWVQSAPGGEGFYNVAISEQVKNARLDFGNWRPSVVSGTKYHDLNGSGTHDAGEPGVEGVRIELRDLGGNVVSDTETDVDGYYEFNQVAPGHYAVYEEANPALRQSQPGPKEGGYHYVVTTSGSNHPYRNFGNYTPVTISGSVVQVNNKTTEHDPTVRDFRDLKVQLQRMGPTGDPTPQKTADASEPMILDLDENGAFEASGLQPGDWQASVLLAEFWSAVSSNPVDVFVPSGDAADIGFEVYFDGLAAPEVRTGSITGSVFRNTTANHFFEKGSDPMVTGQSVRLLGTSARGAVIDLQTSTGADGSYTFTELPAGNYVVSLSGVADSLKQGWPWADGHRIVLGDAQHVGSTFAAQDAAHPSAPVNSDLPWMSRNWAAYANLWMRIDDDGDGLADRRNFFSGGAMLTRTSNNGVWPIVAAHTALQMAGTDSLGRTIRAVSPAGGSLSIISPGAGPNNLPGTWTQGLDLNLDLAEGLWYGPTASSLSNEPAVVAMADIAQWLSLHTAAEFVAQAGSVPVLRDPMGTPVATVLSASYVYTPGPDFGLTPKRFDASDDGDGDDDGGTGSGSGGIGTSDPGDGANLPSDFALGSAYPNPFNPSTVVPFELAAAGHVQLTVYDVMGRRVSTLVNGTMSAGRHTLAWDAAGLPSGVYVLQLRAGGKQFVSKVTLLK